MVHVILWGSLKPLIGGKTGIDVEAQTIREIRDQLLVLYPALEPYFKRGIAMSVDGLIYQNSWNQPVKPNSEVYLLPRLAGG